MEIRNIENMKVKTIIKCVKCQAEVQVSEALFYKSKGRCKSCYYVRFEKPKLIEKIFKEIKQQKQNGNGF